MGTMVTASRMKPDSVNRVAEIFAEFDGTEIPAAIGLVRRQLFIYNDIQVHVYDFEDDADESALATVKLDPRMGQLAADLAPYVTPLNSETWSSPADSSASVFYKWLGSLGASPAAMHSTIIVARLAAEDISTVEGLFSEFDRTTELPERMGTRRRQLFSLDGLYFHVQDFDDHRGGSRIEDAKSDPRFVRISQDLNPYIKVFDPDTWRSPSDAMATRFYHWSATTPSITETELLNDI
ncbi:TcmI family type II polyketide cyclase [Rhodococcus erythropolis]|uniref:TcmI family type II polyketide cyclase n=1 Tax=Rhodococcus erythropolis TaxID=1833 RepID=UPI00366FD53A